MLSEGYQRDARRLAALRDDIREPRRCGLLRLPADAWRCEPPRALLPELEARVGVLRELAFRAARFRAAGFREDAVFLAVELRVEAVDFRAVDFLAAGLREETVFLAVGFLEADARCVADFLEAGFLAAGLREEAVFLAVGFFEADVRRVADFRVVEAFRDADVPVDLREAELVREDAFRAVPFRAALFPAALLRAVLFRAEPLLDGADTLERLVRLDCGINLTPMKYIGPLR